MFACYQPRPYYEAQDPDNGWTELIPINKTFRCWNCADTEEICTRKNLWDHRNNNVNENIVNLNETTGNVTDVTNVTVVTGLDQMGYCETDFACFR